MRVITRDEICALNTADRDARVMRELRKISQCEIDRKLDAIDIFNDVIR